MGNFFSRGKKSTLERLECLDSEISKLEKGRHHLLLTQRRYVGYCFVLSSLIYVLVAAFSCSVYYFGYRNDWPSLLLPLVAFPIVLWMVKFLIQQYYSFRLEWDEARLVELREERRDLLDNVKETETWKKATEILEKFDPNFRLLKGRIDGDKVAENSEDSDTADTTRRRRRHSPHSVNSDVPQASEGRPRSLSLVRPSSNQSLVATTPAPTSARPQLVMHFDAPQPQSKLTTAAAASPSLIPNQLDPQAMGRNSAAPHLIRPVIAADRTPLDKIVDYLFGDGPNRRFALICVHCQSHNGMALEEEFEYLAFRCCYCFAFNPARKHRLLAPKMQLRFKDASLTNGDDKQEAGLATTTGDSSRSQPTKSKSNSVTDGDNSNWPSSVEDVDGFSIDGGRKLSTQSDTDEKSFDFATIPDEGIAAASSDHFDTVDHQQSGGSK